MRLNGQEKYRNKINYTPPKDTLEHLKNLETEDNDAIKKQAILKMTCFLGGGEVALPSICTISVKFAKILGFTAITFLYMAL